jgi:hypothetical protein
VQRPFDAPGAVIAVASVRDCRKRLTLPRERSIEVGSRGFLIVALDAHLDKYLATLRNEAKTVDMKKSTIKKFCEEFRPLMMSQRIGANTLSATKTPQNEPRKEAAERGVEVGAERSRDRNLWVSIYKRVAKSARVAVISPLRCRWRQTTTAYLAGNY